MTGFLLKNTVKALGVLLLAGMMTACGGVSLLGPTGPPPDVYDLSPKSTFDDDLPTVDWQLVVEEPVASRALDTDRIMIKSTPFAIGYLAGGRWSDRAPRMIQTRLVESFENTHRIVAVGRQVIGLRGDYNLKSELREFQAEYFEGPDGRSVLVRMNFKIIEMPSANIIASTTFERREAIEGENAEAIVTAFDDALGGVMKRAVQWSLRTIEEYRQTHAEELGLFQAEAHNSMVVNRAGESGTHNAEVPALPSNDNETPDALPASQRP